MDSKADLRYTEDPPAYTPPASSPYLAADAAPRTTPYPAAGRQQYPTPSVYLPPAQQYPPPAGPAPFGQQYGYAQPPAPAASYPPQPGYGTPQYVTAPPPQQVVVVSGAPQQPAVIVQHVPSYCGLIVLSCFVFFFCNPLFGFIAFILAVVASSTAVSDAESAKSLGQASIGLSIAGIVIAVIVVIIVVAVVVSSASALADASDSSYSYSNYYD